MFLIPFAAAGSLTATDRCIEEKIYEFGGMVWVELESCDYLA